MLYALQYRRSQGIRLGYYTITRKIAANFEDTPPHMVITSITMFIVATIVPDSALAGYCT